MKRSKFLGAFFIRRNSVILEVFWMILEGLEHFLEVRAPVLEGFRGFLEA